MKPFRFQQFEIQQSKQVFRVGTDGVLLGAMANVSGRVLEVGTGTGLISLMLAQRFPKSLITAIDIDPNAAQLAQTNFQNSPFSDRLGVLNIDFKALNPPYPFDYIVSNPPYFEANASQKDILARQKLELDFPTLISKSFSLLSPKGALIVIIPSTEAKGFIDTALQQGFFLKQIVNIYGIQGGALKRNLLELSKLNLPTQSTNFTIESSPRQYSPQYLSLTQNFHPLRGEHLATAWQAIRP